MSHFETETLTQEVNLKGLTQMNSQWEELAMAHTQHRRVILDMDSSDSDSSASVIPSSHGFVTNSRRTRTMVTTDITNVRPNRMGVKLLIHFV